MSPSCCNSNHEAKQSFEVASLLRQCLIKCSDSAPWLVVGLVSTMILKQIKLPTSSIKKFLSFQSKSPSLWNLFTICLLSSLIGLATPLCSCGAIPMAIGLSTAGSSPAAVVAFLTAAQSAGLDSTAITVGMLGWQTAAFRLVGAIILSVGAGMAVGRVNIPTIMQENDGAGSETNSDDTTTTNDKTKNSGNNGSEDSVIQQIINLFKSMYSLFDEIVFVLMLGIVISVLVENKWGASDIALSFGNGGVSSIQSAEDEYVPQPDWWDEEEDGPYPEPPSTSPLINDFSYYQDALTRATVTAGALPFQLCEHGVVSFAGALQKSGATHGTAHAFLLTAPATNIATLGTVLKATGGLDRLAPIRSAFAIFFLAFIMSYVLDYTSFFALNTNLGEAIETIVLPDWWSNGSVIVCGCMVLISLGIRILNLFHCSRKKSSMSVGDVDFSNKTSKVE